MTPIERAARALALAYICGRDNRTPDDEYARQYANAAWQQHSPQVVAVLKAIREPSEGMYDTAMEQCGYDASPTMYWQAMIDAALAEGE